MSVFVDLKKSLPVLGIGLGLRRELAAETFANSAGIDWLEIVPENYMGLGGKSQDLLEAACESFPLVTHGVNLSIGSTDDLNEDYLKNIKALLDKIDAPWWSDHLCFTSLEGHYLHDLLPLPFSSEAVQHVAKRVRKVQSYIGRPFLLENISAYMSVPGSQLTEAQFLSEVLEAADCGLLLDVNNIFVNSVNHGFDAYEFVDSIPIERAVQVHIAGHKLQHELIIDTHGEAVIEPVFELLEYVLKKVPVNAIMLERDQNFPEFSDIMQELSKIASIAQRTRPELVVHRSMVRQEDECVSAISS